jgi:hypothetical protein
MKALRISLAACFLVARLSASADGAGAAENSLGLALTPDVQTNVVNNPFKIELTRGGQLYANAEASFVWTVDNQSVFNNGTTITGNNDWRCIDTITTVYGVQVSISNAIVATLTAKVLTIMPPEITNTWITTAADDVKFRVDAIGGMLSYQWYWQGRVIPGATNASLIYDNAYANANAGYYWVVVKNPAGSISTYPHAWLFTKPTPSGNYRGLFYVTNGAIPETSGSFQFKVTASNRGYSGKLQNNTNWYPFSGAFAADHAATNHISRGSKSELLLKLQLKTVAEEPQILGTVEGSTQGTNWVAPLLGNPMFYSAKRPYARSGKYTLTLCTTNLTDDSPNGTGYGIVMVKKDGTVSLTGQTPDGTTFSQSSTIFKHGDWPFYIPMFKGRGMLIGWLHFAEDKSGNIDGFPVFWQKYPRQGDLYYPNGFTASLTAVGSAYSPSSKSSILPFSTGVATFWGGDLFYTPNGEASVWDFVKVLQPKKNLFVAEEGIENVKLTLAPATGLVTGQLIDYNDQAPNHKQVTLFRGIVIQNQGYAAGYFLNSGKSGSFHLAKDAFTGF